MLYENPVVLACLKHFESICHIINLLIIVDHFGELLIWSYIIEKNEFAHNEVTAEMLINSLELTHISFR